MIDHIFCTAGLDHQGNHDVLFHTSFNCIENKLATAPLNVPKGPVVRKGKIKILWLTLFLRRNITYRQVRLEVELSAAWGPHRGSRDHRSGLGPSGCNPDGENANLSTESFEWRYVRSGGKSRLAIMPATKLVY